MDYCDKAINDKIVSVPEGPVCEDCGDAVDVFKPKTVEDIKEEQRTVAGFRTHFNTIRDSIRKAKKKGLDLRHKPEKVKSTSRVGVQLLAPVRFVPDVSFKLKMEHPDRHSTHQHYP